MSSTKEQMGKMVMQMMDIVDHLGLSDEDILKLTETLIAFVKESREIMMQEVSSHRGELNREISAVLSGVIKQINTRLSELQNGKDGRDGRDGRDGVDGKDGRDGVSPDIQEIVLQVLDLIEIPSVEEILKSIPEGDQISIDTVEGLREELSALKKTQGTSGSIMPVSHWPLHESFTMDGIATTITLSQGVGAAGTAIFGLRYQGQTQALGVDYTVSGNKITFVTFTPIADSIIDITYLP